MSASFTESVVEDAALAWLEALGYAIKHSLEIAALCDARAPELISGELRVKDAERIVGRCV